MKASGKVPPRNKRGLRTGYTTGACTAAAARAAVRALVTGVVPADIRTTLPNGQDVTFAIERGELAGDRAICGVIKDAGDDPDCTHGAELVAEVRLTDARGVDIDGGDGVARVTKPGLGLEVGTAAINPVPRRNITDMVRAELDGAPFRGARVTVHVPGGQQMAEKTTNARLGLLGGISILGTTGIVRPYSTAAFKASVVQSVDVARTRGRDELVLTTGGRSERHAMSLLRLPEDSYIQMGDFVGVALKRCDRAGVGRVHIVGMIGKLSKMADGRAQTHAAGSRVNTALLAEIAAGAGAPATVCALIEEATTARRALELCDEAGVDLAAGVCRRAADALSRHAGSAELCVHIIDFEGRLLASHPRPPRLQEAS